MDKTRIFQAIRRKLQEKPANADTHEPYHTVYEVKLRASNASRDLEGIYQCVIERQYDRLYVISSVTVQGNISPFPSRPKVDLVSCEGTNYDSLNEHISISRTRPTCIRCKGYGFPLPRVGIYNHMDEEVAIYRDGGVTRYTNVADGGIPEVTYTWKTPGTQRFLSDQFYTCRASNDIASSSVRFWILLR